MGRPVRIAVVVLAALGAVCLPTAAFANDAVPASNNTLVIGNDNQLAGDDIFNAGHDNTVGSYNGAQSGVGVGTGTGTGTGTASDDDADAVSNNTFVMGNDNQLAANDIFDAANDNTVGSHNGGSSGVAVADGMVDAAGSTMVE
ncbi:hypothetical protein P3T37_002816 [Kitasatospora sp. MAA4]|uniref:hypothetical protein n=1 Tax=Kitasatospora sp. MAA4 TaxID=3035093 RepID=UPI002476B1B4|nr:hypothetical protein [Kitasatospora sp. MAA4]MDH6133421.1 hypothetical protein [Kitasatospora sp. MAA4]